MNKKLAAALVCLLVALAVNIASPIPARADVPHMPDVTAEMSQSGYWSGKMGNPDAVLATPDEIAVMNDTILHDPATCMNDLAGWQEDSFDGVAYAQALKDAADSDARYFYSPSCWGRYYWDDAQGKGVYMASWEEAYDKLYGAMIENAYDQDAATDMPIRFGICTTRTNVLCFPSNARILDAENDPDFDWQFQTMVRPGEPLVIKGESNDGAYYHVYVSCTSGWVPAADIAVCANKAEWLDAWQFAPQETLVVLDDKIFTEESYYAPAASQKLLPMGTCLKLATSDEYGNGELLADINRSGYNCHVVWLPIRSDNGSYAKMLALISEHCKVSEGFLPLTYANIAKVALNQLGDEYGWGGMLSSDDCSGYVRDVYKCFGLELARNTTWQEAQPVRKYWFAGMPDAERADTIRSLPLGSVLFFNGHEMLYLGEDGGKLYVISSVSSVVLDGARTRIRGGVINTLDIQRANGNTWLHELTSANIPYLSQDSDPAIEAIAYQCQSGADGQWVKGFESGLTFVFERNADNETALTHFTGLTVDGATVTADSDYRLVAGGVIVELEPDFLESLDAGSHSLVASFDDASDVAVGFTTMSQDKPEVKTYAISVSASNGGFVGVSTAVAQEGETVTLTVRPDEGFSLEGVSVRSSAGEEIATATEGDATYSFVMPACDVSASATFAAPPQPAPTPTPDATVAYRTHVQTFGWQDYVRDGVTSGTEGQSKRLEGINIKLEKQPAAGSIEYRTHVQTFGWQDYVRDGATSGTEGQSKRLEAIQVRLTGQMAHNYDVWYRVHAQTFGWLGWAKNDSPAGTAGLSKRLEAIQIVVLPKGSVAPTTAFGAFVSADGTTPSQTASGHDVAYRTHVQTFGWQDFVYDGQLSGTEGLSKRLEAIRIRLASPLYKGSIEYRTHVQTYGWQQYVRNGALSGTQGQSKRLEAIQIRLTGQMAEHYDVWYRVHAQTFGWLDWAQNDEPAGTAGLSKRLEGIQVLLLPKGSDAPGPTDNAFRE